jgi:hypothetical protein
LLDVAQKFNEPKTCHGSLEVLEGWERFPNFARPVVVFDNYRDQDSQEMGTTFIQ